MKYKLFSLLSIGLMLTACGQQNKNETTMDFVDNVKVALADSGTINLDSLQWTREPAGFEVKGDTIRITTAPKTDLWQRTYYHFQNDNAPVLQMKTREKFFSFVVKTDFTGSHHRFQRGDEQRLFRLGHDSYSCRCEDDVVPILPPRG